ncbi:Ig-like domain-containing protein [Marinobacter sp. OP 3.4]|uniref:Ig-like domain-containing protein n=1 Tax=Marinobacter sp. OP 3.4 TaxID=3076501 RepID=UPI002E24AC91
MLLATAIVWGATPAFGATSPGLVQGVDALEADESRTSEALAQPVGLNFTPHPLNSVKDEVVVIDTSVENWRMLVRGVPADATVVPVASGDDGLDALADALRGRSGIRALYIISHGESGALRLGASRIDAGMLEHRADAIATIRGALSVDADIFLAGCNLAQGERGRRFINELAAGTGADVAASTNITGAQDRAGDWVLEYATGELASSSDLTANAVLAGSALENYDGVLATQFESSLNAGANPLSGVPNWEVIVGDFDTDGDVDVLAYDDNTYSSATFYQNDGNGGFTAVTGESDPFNDVTDYFFVSSNVYVADFDNDGDVDIWDFRGDTGGDGTSRYYENTGGSTYTSSLSGGNNPLSGVPDIGTGVIVGDFDTDGDVDVLAFDDDTYSSTTFYQNDGSGDFTAVTGASSPFEGIDAVDQFYASSNVFVADFDNDSDVDIWDYRGETQGDGNSIYLEQLETPPLILTSTPTDDATGASTSDSIVITFDESVQLGSGNIEIRHVADDTPASTATLSGGTVTGGDATVSLSTTNTTNDTLTINAALPGTTDLYVHIDPSALSDTADGAAALSLNDNPDTLNFATGTANDAPTLDLDTGAAGSDHTAAFSENTDQGTANTDGVTVTGAVATSDSDGTVETVTLTLDNPQGDAGEGLDVDTASLASALGFTTSANQITITRNTASNAELVAAIEAVRYQNNSDNPDTTGRTVTIEATDDGGASTSATSTVTLEASNDAPVLTAGGSDPNFSEGGSPVGLFSGTTFSTIESGQTLSDLTLTIDNLANGVSEILSVDGSSITLVNGETGSTANNGLNFSVSMVNSTATVSFSTATLSNSQAKTLIDNLSYGNSSVNISPSTRAVTLTSITDNGGTSNGGDDTTALNIVSTVSLADNVDPIVSDANISLSGGTGNSGSYVLGDTVTASWNNTASGDNNRDIINTVTVDFSAFGGGSSVTATSTSGTWSASYGIDGSSVSGSDLNVSVSVTDNAGNATTTTDSSNATVDNATPSGHSVSFDDGTISAAEATATSFTFASAEVGADYSYTISSGGGGTPVSGTGTVATANEQIANLDLSGLSEGTLTLSVTLTDPAGNTASSVTDTATLDSTAPSGHSVSFDDETYNNSETGAASFTFSSAEVGAEYSYTVSSNGGGTPVVGTGTVSGVSAQIVGLDLSSLSDGTLTLSVTLTDTAGNSAVAVTDTATLDASAPSGQSVSFDDATYNSGEAGSASFTFSSAEVGADFSYTVSSNGGGTPLTGTGNVASAGEQVGGLDLSGLSDGTLTLSVTLTDTAGNAATAVTDTATLDASAPNGQSVSFDDATLNGSEAGAASFTFGNAEVGADYSYSISSSGGGTPVTGSGTLASAGDQVAGIDLSGLVDGTLTLSAELTDSAGNTASPVMDTATLDTAAPTGHTVSFDQSDVGAASVGSVSFAFASAEVGTEYSYTISSSGGGTPVTGTGTIAGAGEQVTGVDLTGLGEGTITLSAVLTDTAGNAAAAVTDTASLDTTAAAPTLATAAGDPVNAPFDVTVSFTESVTGFTADDIAVTNGSVSNFAGADADYTATVTPTVDGTVTVDVSAGVAQDTAGNDSTAANSLVLEYDGSTPVPAITGGDAGTTVNGPVDVTVDFGEPVSGFMPEDVSVTNASLGGFTDEGNGSFSVTVTASGDGEITLSVPAGVAGDVAGNDNEASNTFTLTYDGSGPMLQSSTPGNGDTDVPYDSSLMLVFDEPVVADSGQLTLRDLTDGQDHSVLSITDARVTVADKQVTVVLDEPLVPTHEYALRVDADSLLDEAGNGWAGIQDDATLHFTAGNLAPEAGSDSATLGQDTRLALDVLANDVDEEGRLNPASVRVVTAPAHGRVEVETATGAVTYQPEAGYTGADSFTYVVEDEFGGESNPATVSLTVEPAGLPPVTRGDTARVAPGGTATLAMLDNDRAGATDVALDPQSVALVLRPHHGTAEWANGELTYTADEGFEGVERLAYTVADTDGVRSAATPLFINVSDGGTAPVARNDSVSTDVATAMPVEVLTNDEASGSALASATVELGRLPGHGMAEVDPDTGDILYTPDADFRGEDVFHYTVRDDRGLVSDTASVTVSVGLTGAPLARNDQVWTLGGAALAINVLGNDRGLDGELDPATLSLVDSPAQGQVTLDTAAGLFRYTPDETFSGPDSFTYTVRDEGGQLSAPATVTVTDQPGNNRPLANDRYLAVAEDSEANLSPLSNDQDLNGNLAVDSLQVRQQPLNGTLTTGGDGTVSYTPAEDFYGEDRFTYTIADDTGRKSELAVIRLVVAPVADKPLINGTPQTTVPAGTAFRFTPTATDIDGNPLTFSVDNLPAWASFDESNGRLQGTPDLEQVGASEPIVITASNGEEEASLPAFRIQVTDNAGGSDDGGDDPVSSPVQPGEDETSDRQLVDPADPVLNTPASGWPSYTDEQPSRARYDIEYVDATGVPRNVSVVLDDPSAPLPATNNDGNGGQTLTFSQNDGSEQVVRIDPTGGTEVSSFRQGGDAEPGSRLVSQARDLVVTALPQGGMRSEAVFGDEGPGQTRVVIDQSPTGEVTVASVYTDADGNDQTTAVAFDPVPANLMLAADGTVTVTSGAVGGNEVAAQEYRITPGGEVSILSRRNAPSDGVLSSAIAVRSAGSTGAVEADGYTMVDLPAGATSQAAEITADGRVQYQENGNLVDLAPGSAIALGSDGVEVVSRNADPDRNGLGRAAEIVSGAGGSQNLARIEITDVESGNENLRVEEADDGDGFEVSQTLPDGGGVLSSRIRLDGSSQHRLAGRSAQSDNEMTVRLPVNLSIRFADRVVAVADSGDAAMLAELLASGEVRHEVAIGGESTRASSRIPGTRTVMEEGPDGSPQITTRSAAEGRTMTVVADSLGRARHSLVNRAGMESRAEFNAPGASTTIDEDGTIRARSRLGDGDRCAWAETFGNGETGTGFGYYDSDAVRCIGIDAPTSLDSLFEPGASVTVDDDDSGASITVETPLTRPLRF